MEKKFEIINDKWIIQRKEESKEFTATMIKIDAINYIHTSEDKYESKWFWFSLSTTHRDHCIQLNYTNEEKEQYDADLKLLQNLIFNRK